MNMLERLKNRKDEGGFSLVEMVVAIGVLGILAVAAYPLMFHSMQAVSLNNITTTATVKVQDLMEDIRNDPTCLNINNIKATSSNYEDARGIQYKVVLTLPVECVDGEAVAINFKATRTSDAKVLLDQKTQIFVPPLSGSFDLD